MEQLATIVPSKDLDGFSSVKTQGTRVVLPSGEHLPAVTRVEITGGVDDRWRARIHCFVRIDPAGLTVLATVHRQARLTWWQRLCARLGGFTVDCTHFESRIKEHTKT